MAAFNADIFTYTTGLNSTTYVIEGTLSPVSSATAGNCPQGRFLYENGRKLFTGANPGITTYMVGVFDPVSFLNGYIDPNSEKFTLMNTDKPVDQANSSNVFGTNPNGSTSDLAPPVFTRGDVIVGGDVIVTGHIRSEPFTVLSNITGTGATAQNISLDTSLGENFSITSAITGSVSGVNFDITGTLNAGDIIRVFITNSPSFTITFANGTNTSVFSAVAGVASMSILTLPNIICDRFNSLNNPTYNPYSPCNSPHHYNKNRRLRAAYHHIAAHPHPSHQLPLPPKQPQMYQPPGLQWSS
jgi:hypothetical protein